MLHADVSSVFSMTMAGTGPAHLPQADITLGCAGPLEVALPAKEVESGKGEGDQNRQCHKSCKQVTFGSDAGAWEKNLFTACSCVIFNAPSQASGLNTLLTQGKSHAPTTKWAGNSRYHVTNPPIQAERPVTGTTGLLVICWHLNF